MDRSTLLAVRPAPDANTDRERRARPHVRAARPAAGASAESLAAVGLLAARVDPGRPFRGGCNVETFTVIVMVAVLVGVVAYLVGSLIRSIQNERRQNNLRRVWHNFGLSIAFCALFLLSWAAQGVAEWQSYAEQQREHNQPVEATGYLVQFGQSTLENWQSEFLQLFSFVVLSAMLIHHGSAESKDSDDRMEEILHRIEQKLDERKAA
jgi:NADH:ubiquinone oxidoreductase subunit 6 (subunit J)